MSAIEIKRVTDKRGLDTFIQLHYDLYRGNQYDAPNLYRDEFRTLSRDKNSAFEFCDAEYFLAYRDGKVVGRVAAIINHRYNKQWQRPCVRFGWLDLVDDAEVMRARHGSRGNAHQGIRPTGHYGHPLQPSLLSKVDGADGRL